MSKILEWLIAKATQAAMPKGNDSKKPRPPKNKKGKGRHS